MYSAVVKASEGVPYHQGQPRVAKPIIESKHQLRPSPGRSSVISGKLQAGGVAYVCVWLERSYEL
jgi:hypothetical protein